MIIVLNLTALQASEHLAAVSKPKVNSIQLTVFTGRAYEENTQQTEKLS